MSLAFSLRTKLFYGIPLDDDGEQAPGENWGAGPTVVLTLVTVNEGTHAAKMHQDIHLWFIHSLCVCYTV